MPMGELCRRTGELVKTSTQKYSNREAQRLIQEHLEVKTTFGIETTLADEETWKFLKGVKKIGYRIHIFFLSTDNIQLLHQRITERALRGEHFVRQDIVEERYYVGLKLLSHYFTVPDVVQLLDNSASLVAVAVKKEDLYVVTAPTLPEWFVTSLLHHFNPLRKATGIKDLSTIEDVRKQYQQSKENDE